MKLLFYDKFFESLIDLPKGIQKKVIDFQRKFRENSKSSAIHLEPIKNFKDSSLRSARVDQTYRAIIKVPEVGETYFLLWVDHHDKAYEWATNKVFQWNENTQSMQVFTSPEIIEKQEEVRPEITIEKRALFSEYTDKDLLRVGVPKVLLPSIRGIETLDGLEHVETFIPQDTFENLFYLADGASVEQLIFEIEEGKTEAVSEEEQLRSINNQRSFIELTDDELFNEILEGNLKKWKYYLHPSQRKLVNGSFTGTVKVSGGAGTGKTVAALHRLKYLSKNRKPAEKILFTTYTKALTENLKNLSNDLEIDLSGIKISNIDALAFDLVKDFVLISNDYKVFGLHHIKNPEEIWEEVLDTELTTFDTDFLSKEYREIVLYHDVKSLEEYLKAPRVGRGKAISRTQRRVVWSLVEKYNRIKGQYHYYHKEELYNLLVNFLKSHDTKVYDFGLVDELQDFSNVELRVVRALVEEKPNDLFLVGDPLQKIYDKRINFSQSGINVRGKRSRRLRINYRTTEEIKKLAISIVNDEHYDNFDGQEEEKAGYVSLFHGNQPQYTVFHSKDQEVQHVISEIEYLLEGKYKPEEIAITSRTKNALKEFRTELHLKNIPYTEYEQGNKVGHQNGVNLLTFHNIKGLEFKQVFLVDVNNRTCPKHFEALDNYSDTEKASYYKNEKSLLYVAVSRAIQRVEITGIGIRSELVRV
ncbi:UvrD-helicase domain-containing protein [Cyclobacterium jeungdonense]|uniref:DNA 3'-5' helicase n=1 Tax=Cyclobacterium jeungdonense TaxID=708087 RepID=A0ABT8C614_9BACT|nr:UvrD-helicase domain-containing protein [Cyclobacterium jeungdonense]MDN3688234.1 3'-5' exonuclease [Cyclobacterium jeungdonense]